MIGRVSIQRRLAKLETIRKKTHPAQDDWVRQAQLESWERWLVAFKRLLLGPVWEAQALRVTPLIRQWIRDMTAGDYSTKPGIAEWVDHLKDGALMPDPVPPEVIEMYITDPTARPEHDCADCGLEVPVRPRRPPDSYSGFVSPEPEANRRYFPDCPCCGGPTGYMAYWEKHQCSLKEMEQRRAWAATAETRK